MSGDSEVVLTEWREGVLLITLNRPGARNAVNLPLAEGIATALDELDGEDALSVGVLTGAGKGFCAGMDLKAFDHGRAPVGGRPRLCRDCAASVGKAADRGDRGLRCGGRPGGSARVRFDRGGPWSQVGHP